MRFAAVLALLSCLVATACGAASTQQAADKTEAVSAPPIEAIDEPARDDVADLWASEDDGSGSYAQSYICLGDESTEADEPCKPSPEEIEDLRRIGENAERALMPAEGSEPRKIARLRLTARGPRSRAFLIAWRNRADKLCLAESEEDEDGGGGSGPFGPCVLEGRCQELCLTLSGSGIGQNSLYSTSGVVASCGAERDSFRGRCLRRRQGKSEKGRGRLA